MGCRSSGVPIGVPMIGVPSASRLERRRPPPLTIARPRGEPLPTIRRVRVYEMDEDEDETDASSEVADEVVGSPSKSAPEASTSPRRDPPPPPPKPTHAPGSVEEALATIEAEDAERVARKGRSKGKGKAKGKAKGKSVRWADRADGADGRTERTERLRRDRDRRWFARRRRRVSRRRCGRCSGTTCERSIGARWVARRTGRVKMKGCNNSSRASEVDERRNDSFFAARTISRRLDTCRARLIGKRWMSVGRLDGVGMRTCVMVRGIRSRARRRNPRP